MFLLERRIREQRAREAELRRDKAAAEKEKLDQQHRDAMQIIVSFGGAVLLPFSVISGIFGMNNTDLPAYVSSRKKKSEKTLYRYFFILSGFLGLVDWRDRHCIWCVVSDVFHCVLLHSKEQKA